MRIAREIARFFLTAIAVALAVPLSFAALDLLTAPALSSMDAFAGVARLSFVLAIVGGTFVGLPALWIARRHGWHRSLPRMTAWGGTAGMLAGGLIAIALFEGDVSVVAIILPAWMIVGGFAGIVAALVWVLLHASEETAQAE